MANLKSQFEAVRAAALAYPEAYEESPWGELAIKVRKKVFVFLGGKDGSKLSLSLKLPESRARALELPQAQPTGYGLGKHGWVSFGFVDPNDVPLQVLLDWLDESYRVVAPKRLVKALTDRPSDVAAAAPVLRADGKRLLLIGDDPLRLERARELLAHSGADVVCVGLAEALDAAGGGAPDAVIVDLSRNAAKARALLVDLGLVVEGGVFVAGVRDAKMERQVEALHGLAWHSREPPGEPSYVRGLLERL